MRGILSCTRQITRTYVPGNALNDAVPRITLDDGSRLYFRGSNRLEILRGKIIPKSEINYISTRLNNMEKKLNSKNTEEIAELIRKDSSREEVEKRSAFSRLEKEYFLALSSKRQAAKVSKHIEKRIKLPMAETAM